MSILKIGIFLFIIGFIIILLSFKTNKERFLNQSPFYSEINNEFNELDILIDKSYNNLFEKSIYEHELLDIKYFKSEPLDSKMINNITNYFPLNLQEIYKNSTMKNIFPLQDNTLALVPEQIAIDYINYNPNSNSLRFIIGLHSIYINIIVADNIELNNYKDLDGKTIGLLPNIANIYINKIFDILGIKMNYKVLKIMKIFN